MSTRNLDSLFKPQSVALIGASNKPHGIGATVLKNLVEGGYAGQIWPLNPKYHELQGLKCYAKVGALPAAPDLALICTPAPTIPGLIRELGARGTRAAIVMTAGLDAHKPGAKSVEQAMLDAAKPHLLRILGPGSVGLLAPHIGLNASYAHLTPQAGKIAFVSQSGALATGVLDWASARGIGFSKFISLGGGADVDFGDLLDYLAGDADTGAILLYLRDLRGARKFMSAARVAARSKPVIVLKAGRDAADAVYDAAIRRAGMLRVDSTEDLFDAVETLAHARPQRGGRLIILGNGAGLGLMARDALGGGASLAALSPATVAQLGQLLPGWSGENPIDVGADATLERYVAALGPLLAEPQADALLFMHAPTALASSAEIAQALAPMMRAAGRNVLSCWLGGPALATAREIFSQAGIPGYDTPEKAVHAFMQIVQYRRNQELLMQVPACLPAAAAPRRERARAIVAAALAAGQGALGECQALALLAAYGIAVLETRLAADVEQALALASEIGYPVALKLHAPELGRKAEVGGVALDLETPRALGAAAQAMLGRLGRLRPQAAKAGFLLQPMARRPLAREVSVGVTLDPVFGPVVLVGQGGIAAEVAADRACGLPPLNMVLARDMIERTRVARLLAGYRERPAADLDALARTLIQVAELAADIGELAELDINSLLCDADGVLALGARVLLRAGGNADRLAIRPYPQELEQAIAWRERTLTLRPIRPEDAPQHVEFFNALHPDDVRLRFFTAMRELPPSQLARLTQIDYDRAMAFIATARAADGHEETLGVVRAVADPDNIEADFAIVVRSDLKGQGLGPILFGKLVDYFRGRGTEDIVGEALSQNMGVQHLVKRFGGEVHPSSEPGTVTLRLKLQSAHPPSS